MARKALLLALSLIAHATAQTPAQPPAATQKEKADDRAAAALFGLSDHAGGVSSVAAGSLPPETETLPTRPRTAPFQLSNASLARIISVVWGVDSQRITGKPVSDSSAYTLFMEEGRPSDPAWKERLKTMVCDTLHIVVTTESRVTPVLVLRAGTEPGKSISENSSGGSSLRATPTSFEGASAPLSLMVAPLSQIAKVTVVDETGLKGRYNYSFSVPGRYSNFVKELRIQLGLAATYEKRPLDWLVVTNKPKEKNK
jgi:uncharacterized protein (TIGR03435 family)